jgi:hypothetical protein
MLSDIPPSLPSVADIESVPPDSVGSVPVPVPGPWDSLPWLSLFEFDCELLPLSPHPPSAMTSAQHPKVRPLSRMTRSIGAAPLACQRAGSRRTIAAMADRIYAWDFYGPHAEGTAKHFLEHLGTFFQRTPELGELVAGLESGGAGHHAVWCRTSDAAEPWILPLRPRRSRPA